MCTSLLLALALALPAAPARALDGDGALSLLRETLDPPPASYSGQLTVTTREGGRESTRWITVEYAPPSSYRREVLDRYGSPELITVSDGRTQWVYDRRSGRAWRGVPAGDDAGLSDPDEELDLLTDNYDVRRAATDTVAGLPCQELVVAPKRGGPPVQRLCVDGEDGLVLRRVVYDADGKESTRVRFERVDTHPSLRPEDFRLRPPAGTRVLRRRPAPDALELGEAARMTAMTPRPAAWVPPGYVFESVSLLPYRGATILHFRWSDGVDALSLFQAPPRARVRPPAGARPVPERVGGADG
ncbi:MAG: hypothetical protein KGL53_00195, partial [Elusimicrobia bacterium]|nr:hypothetical protein [Elusimicrobiota bacterium]